MTRRVLPRDIRDRARALVWPVLPVIAAFIALGGAFSTTSVFYVRDLGQFYYPLHVWYRRTIFAGASPLWDPYVGYGQSAIADPARNLLFPPVVALRLLAPEVLGFNLTVALPFPVAALGCFLLLRRRVSPPAASLGASIFALAGPVLATGNFLNMSWAVALGPWILLAADQLAESCTVRRVAALAVLVALQILAGEPVTLAATALVAAGGVIAAATERNLEWTKIAGRAAATGVSYVAGACLAAPQALPLVDAAARSARSVSLGAGYAWIGSLHPLQCVECVAPWVFGDPLANYLAPPPALMALTNGIEPILYSIYLGVVPVFLALSGVFATTHVRWVRMWGAIAVVSFLWSMGPHTPVYTVATHLIPALSSVRFPSKLMVVAALAVAALAASGWQSLISRERGASEGRGARIGMWAAATVGVAATLVLACSLALPEWSGHAAAVLGVGDGPRAIGFLLKTLPSTAGRLAVLAFAGACLLWIARRRPEHAATARWLLFAVCVLDLLVVNAPLNPTTDARFLGEPRWVAATREHPQDRIYVGPRIFKAVRTASDIDAPQPAALAVSEYPDMVERAREDARLLSFPSSAFVRDSISTDQQALWPLADLLVKERFKTSARDARTRFLERTGVRYAVTPEPPSPDATIITPIPETNGQTLYELARTTPRARVVARAAVTPDTGQQFASLFDTNDSGADD
ncbi:MAG TPA: hypothetical protein PLF26_18235, partial [Blastocatellia bacterium]|nr:hypothetical protein [Blastocatellia bacterium]